VSISPAIARAASTNLGEGDPYGLRAELGIKRVVNWRRRVYKDWLSANENIDPKSLARAIDQLTGLSLVLKFIGQNQLMASRCLEEVLSAAGNHTVRKVSLELQSKFSSPILRAALDPDDHDDDLPIPQSVTRLLVSESPAPRLVLTSFGDFHQLCLSNPLVASPRDAGEPRHDRIRRDH
jgi:hypothetical protein